MNYPREHWAKQYLVQSVQDFVRRLRPLCEWEAFDRDHFSTTEWLASIIDTLADLRREIRDSSGTANRW